MENYISTCPDCKVIYFWSGFKTGIGKTKEQLEQMEKDQTVCKQCGSTNLKTELDHESEDGLTLDNFFKNLFGQ